MLLLLYLRNFFITNGKLRYKAGGWRRPQVKYFAKVNRHAQNWCWVTNVVCARHKITLSLSNIILWYLKKEAAKKKNTHLLLVKALKKPLFRANLCSDLIIFIPFAVNRARAAISVSYTELCFRLWAKGGLSNADLSKLIRRDVRIIN